MPEGDTIWRTAEGLRGSVAGRVVTRAAPDRLAGLAGRTLQAVDTHGKHLLMRFSDGLTLHSHMRMNGSWHVYTAGERWRRPQWQAKAVLEFDDRVAVCFAAPLLELVRDGRERIGHLGPDLLAEGVSLAEVVARARALGPVPLGELLLDQRVCSGIGNVYRCETLWQFARDPWRTSDQLADAELEELFGFARDTLRENLTGSFARSFGGRQAAVHGRRGRPCPRCGAPVRMRGQGELARLTYWCPGCQVR